MMTDGQKLIRQMRIVGASWFIGGVAVTWLAILIGRKHFDYNATNRTTLLYSPNWEESPPIWFIVRYRP